MARPHPMQYLVPDVPIVGPTPERDPEYGVVWTIVDQLGSDALREELADEVDFDGIRTDADGYVHLTLTSSRYRRGDRLGSVRRDVARVAMSSPHADAHLVVLDPKEA